MTPTVRAAALYAAAMLVALALVSALTPTASLVARLVVAHALLGGALALLAWLLLAGPGGPGSFPSLVHAEG